MALAVRPSLVCTMAVSPFPLNSNHLFSELYQNKKVNAAVKCTSCRGQALSLHEDDALH